MQCFPLPGLVLGPELPKQGGGGGVGEVWGCCPARGCLPGGEPLPVKQDRTPACPHPGGLRDEMGYNAHSPYAAQLCLEVGPPEAGVQHITVTMSEFPTGVPVACDQASCCCAPWEDSNPQHAHQRLGWSSGLLAYTWPCPPSLTDTQHSPGEATQATTRNPSDIQMADSPKINGGGVHAGGSTS